VAKAGIVITSLTHTQVIGNSCDLLGFWRNRIDWIYDRQIRRVELMTSHLFSPISFRDVSLHNRIVVSPMCEYSSDDGFANDWHLVHLGSRAVGGAGLIFTEASAVLPEGRISPRDLGIWKDEHIPELRRIVSFIHSQGSRAGMQIAHAGRKASTRRPWEGDGIVTPAEGGWSNVFAPSSIPFAPNYPLPRALDLDGIRNVTEAFVQAARRAAAAGFDLIELHAAHGYLFHEFLSPLSNHRTDEYGGSFENRTRLLTETLAAVRRELPGEMPIFVRISATDWAEGGWDIEESVVLARILKQLGADLVDTSSGGLVPGVKIPIGPGYQVPFAERIRRETGIATGAVGMITNASQADQIIRSGQADIVLLAREMLREPYWPFKAAQELGVQVSWPAQYLRAAPLETSARKGLELRSSFVSEQLTPS
jgi:2,4-dienoyl-CoA reductase-like NADH-dependent reductase (Old Yellow Enzyme family)